MLDHCMVDIETMGSRSMSCIVSIAAVEFDIETGETGETFYTVVDLQSCLDAGLKVEASTIEWWLSQSKSAKSELLKSEKVDIQTALYLLSNFIDKDFYMWGNSARFDLGILSDAYNVLALPIPWDFRKERDVRTLLTLSPSSKGEVKMKGTAHNALDDCRYQIDYCSRAWNEIKT